MPTDPLPDEVLAALTRGNTIEAIKRLREATGLGLAEAKGLIDAHQRGVATITPTSRPAQEPGIGAWPTGVGEALRRGNKIEAIRLLRAQTGLGLKDAKDAIEAGQPFVQVGDGHVTPGAQPKSGGKFWLLFALALIVYLGYRHFSGAAN